MSKRAEELSAAYTDARLELLRPDIAADNYTRGRKMSLDIFDGNEVESAYEAGYEQAEKDLALTGDDIKFIIDKYSELPIQYSPRLFEEILKQFNELRDESKE